MKLYIVATPIGNLEDITLRAIDTLKSVDVIACEDTRHTKILLNKYDIKTKTIAYHKYNEKPSTDGIIKLLQADKNVALVSDAGLPTICDPGNILINRLIEENIPYTVIPGANAMLSALILSGFDSSRFAFFGFLEEKHKDRLTKINDIANFNGTTILYSSKYNIQQDLSELKNGLSGRKVCVCNELTKVFEKAIFGTLSTIEIPTPVGEYVIVLDKGENIKVVPHTSDLYSEIQSLIDNGATVRDACKQVAQTHKLQKHDVYNDYLKHNN